MENDHFSSLFDKLDNDRKNDKLLCDVTISVNNKHFPAHRCILATFCVYFATLFQSSFDDKLNNIIKLTGPIGEEITCDTFDWLLQYLYTAKASITANNVYDILSASEFLQIDRLKAKCLECLKTLINAENLLFSLYGLQILSKNDKISRFG